MWTFAFDDGEAAHASGFDRGCGGAETSLVASSEDDAPSSRRNAPRRRSGFARGVNDLRGEDSTREVGADEYEVIEIGRWY